MKIVLYMLGCSFFVKIYDLVILFELLCKFLDGRALPQIPGCAYFRNHNSLKTLEISCTFLSLAMSSQIAQGTVLRHKAIFSFRIHDA